MKKIVTIIVILATVFCCACALADLSVPQNIHWKDGSTATASWDAVEGANYYYVKVAVYHQNTIVGETETGTTANEIDIQSQINSIVGEKKYEFVKVQFSVCAAVTSSTGGETVKGQYSEPSAQINYGCRKLMTPSNLSLSDQWTLTWDTVDGADMYEYFAKFGDVVYPGGQFVSSFVVNGNKTSCDMSKAVEKMYTLMCQEGYIKKGDTGLMSFSLSARGRFGSGSDSYDLMSDFSSYSNGVSYSNSDVFAISVPSNLKLDDQWTLSWDTVEGASMYEYYAKFNDIVYPSGQFVGAFDVNGTRTTSNMSKAAEKIYTLMCQEGYIKKGDTGSISFSLSARGFFGEDSESVELMSAFSGYSNGKSYSNSNVVTINTPTNLSLNDQWTLSWDTVEGANIYEYYAKFNDTVYPGGQFVDTFKVEGAKTSSNMANAVKKMYALMVQEGYIHDGDTGTMSFQLSARKNCGSGNDGYTLMTEFSKYSNGVFFGGEIPVQSITLSPNVPILYQGNDLYLGVTIQPENAVYSTVEWTSSDPSVASVDKNGKISGKKEGTTVITAKIGKAVQNATLTVYTVSSNIEKEDYAEVTDTAGSIIDEIGNNVNPDISNTDLEQNQVASAQKDIHNGIERGDKFHSDMTQSKKDKDHFSQYWSEIQKLVTDGNFAGAYDINVEVYHQDNSGKKYHVVDITQFDKKIGFTVKTDNLPAATSGQTREFTMLRIHDGVVEKIPVTQNADGSFSGESDKFSEFVLMYKDTPNESAHIHSLSAHAKEDPTYGKEGTEAYWSCDTCQKLFSDAEAAKEISSPVSIPKLQPASQIHAFVIRCYLLILDREPDAGGLEYWAEKLSSGVATAAEIINGFVESVEFKGKNLSYGDQVEVLYQVMLNRASDAGGKSYWVSMLNGGNSLAAIINGFCNSVEFKGICSDYGITAGSVDAGELKPPKEVPVVDINKIRAFVTRNYRVILDREPDADGLNYWAQRLASGEATAAEIINGFVNSDEFKSKNLSYGDQVEVLYQVMLDRGSDAAGKTYWVSMLNGGNPLAAIINGFCNSIEFRGICAEYGITPGSLNVGELKPPKEVRVVDTNKIKGYITRCYRVILGREPDQGGLDYWTEKMASGELEAAAIIDQFVNSIEFKGKQLSNRDAVEVLYQAMLGRGSDEAGMTYWLTKLEAGDPFAVIINGFCNSQEFKGICAEYGITPGSVAVASVTTYAKPEEEEETPEQTPGQEPEQALEQTHEQEPAEPTPADERTEKARAFVTHCYQSALLRDPGAEEVNYYTEKILSGQMTAKDVARAFAFSQEFQGKWTDSTAFVRVLYRLCLDREADADGLVYWTDKLANGETAAAVFNALTENKEFVQVCATYGVPAGVDANAIRAQEEAAAAAEANEAPAAPASEFTNEEKIRAFVSRFYRDAMGREADEEGLNYYTGRILNGEATPKDVAGEIIFSEEFRGRMPGNEDLVRILYRVYLGREADEEGLANWIGQLDSGVSLETILNGFAGSEEFAAVVNGLK